MKFKHVFLFILLAVFSILSCKKDSGISPDIPENDEIQKALQSLRTQEERDFFDKNFVTNRHPYLLPALKGRDGENDSLANEVLQHLLMLNQSNPFLKNVIDLFGYPAWNQSKIVTGVDNPAYRAVLTPYAKMQENQISGYSMAFPSPLDFSEWHVLIIHRDEIDTLIQAPESCEVINLAWHVAQKLDFDKQLFETQQLDLKEWFEGCMGDDGGEGNGLVKDRCITIEVGYCLESLFNSPNGGIEDRNWPCTWVTYITQEIGCDGSTNPTGAGGAWIGSFGSGNGSTSGSTSGGGGNGSSTNSNEETVIDLYSKYYECLFANPEIADAVWQIQNQFMQDLHLVNQIIDNVLNIMCMEGEGQFMSIDIFKEEFKRALCEFGAQNIARIKSSPLINNTAFMSECLQRAVFTSAGLSQNEINVIFNLEIQLDVISLLINTEYSTQAILAVNSLLKIQMNSNDEFTVDELTDMLNAFDLFFDDPSTNDEALVDAMFENGINPFSTSSTLDALIEESAPIPPSPPATPMTPQVFWQKAGAIKTALLSEYPNKADKIDDLFPCRVMGPAFEEAGLASLGLPKNTVNVGGGVPDAMVNEIMGGGDPFALHQQPNIIELKCRLGSLFDYSGQTSQLNAYLNYLQNEPFWSNTTIMHGLYLIVPDGVEIGQNIIDAANAKNVPLLVSSVSLGNNDVTQFRVNDLDFINVSSLNRSKQMWYWLPDSVFAWARKKSLNRKLDYKAAFIDFQKHADHFEQHWLIGNSNEGCPQD